MNKKIILHDDVEEKIKEEQEFEPTTIYSGRVLLFLDFDGVLHSYQSYYSGKNLFEKLPLFLDILKKVANDEIVISSSWAKKRTTETLRQYFPKSFENRVIGGIHKQTDNRGNDIKKYMKDRGESGPWIALDDMAVFNENDPIVWTDWATGLTEDTASVLRKALQSPIEFKKFCERKNNVRYIRR